MTNNELMSSDELVVLMAEQIRAVSFTKRLLRERIGRATTDELKVLRGWLDSGDGFVNETMYGTAPASGYAYRLIARREYQLRQEKIAQNQKLAPVLSKKLRPVQLTVVGCEEPPQ
jgi:hypothetical protein